MRASLSLAAGLTAWAAGMFSWSMAQAGESSPPPLKLSARWDGPACNPKGATVVTLTNVSAKPLAVPREAQIPSMFMVEVHLGDVVVPSIGHTFAYKMYPDHYVRDGGLKLLQPGEAAQYRLRSIYGKTDGDFGDYYRKLTRRGGELTVRYTMSKESLFDVTDEPLYLLHGDFQPYVHSNMLKCPGARRR